MKLFEKLFKNKSGYTGIQFFRYIVAGSIAFLVDMSLLVLLTEVMELHYLFSAAIAFSAGLLTAYLFSILWIFSKRKLENRWIELFIFAVIGIIGIGLNEFFIWFFTEQIQFHYAFSKIISTALIVPYNFFAKKYTLFY